MTVLGHFRDQLSQQDSTIKHLQEKVHTLESNLSSSELEHSKAQRKLHKVTKQLKFFYKARKDTCRSGLHDQSGYGSTCANVKEIHDGRLCTKNKQGPLVAMSNLTSQHCPGSSNNSVTVSSGWDLNMQIVNPQSDISSSQLSPRPVAPVLPQMLTPLVNSAKSPSCVLDGLIASSASSDFGSSPGEGGYITVINTEDSNWNESVKSGPSFCVTSQTALPSVSEHWNKGTDRSANIIWPSVSESHSKVTDIPVTSLVLSHRTKAPLALPILAIKNGTKVLPSSEIDQSSLLSVNQVLKMFESKSIACMAGKLAAMAVFGSEVLKKCTPQGSCHLPALPRDELYHIKQVVLHNTPSIWNDPTAFERIWICDCMKHIATECSSARRNKR